MIKQYVLPQCIQESTTSNKVTNNKIIKLQVIK